MSEEKHIPEVLLNRIYHLKPGVERTRRVKPYSNRSLNASMLKALSESIPPNTSLPSLSPEPAKSLHKSTRLVPISSFRTKVSVHPHSPKATEMLSEGFVLGLNPHREIKVRDTVWKGLENAAEKWMFADPSKSETILGRAASREATMSPFSPKKRTGSPFKDRKFLFRRDQSLLSVAVTEAGSTTTAELMGLHKADLDPTWLDTKLRSLSREEIARVSGLTRALEPFAGIEEWRLSLEGRREEFSQLLVQKFTAEFGPADVKILIDTFLDKRTQILKPLSDLQASQLVKTMFPVVPGQIFMEKQKKQIQHLVERITKNPTSRHIIVEIACSNYFVPDWARIRVFIPASKIFVSMLIKAKIAYYSTISFRARNTLSRYIKDTTKVKYLAKPSDLRVHKEVRTGETDPRRFLQELKGIVGNETLADHRLKEALRDVPADDQVFNRELRHMIGEIRCQLSHGTDEPSQRNSLVSVRNSLGAKEKLRVLYQDDYLGLRKPSKTSSMILNPE